MGATKTCPEVILQHKVSALLKATSVFNEEKCEMLRKCSQNRLHIQ